MKHRYFHVLLATAALGACTSSTPPVVTRPVSVPQPYPISALETRNNGSLYQQSTYVGIFGDAPLAHKIGDKVKIEIAENSSGSNKSTSKLARSHSVATKGPGTDDKDMNKMLRNLLNLDAQASGNDDYSGDGKTENTSSLKGKIAASVINVLPNGNLVISGDRSLAFNGTVNTVRFSGVINPRDLKPDNRIASEDVMEARLEQVGDGLVADSNGKTWLQKMLSDSLLVW